MYSINNLKLILEENSFLINLSVTPGQIIAITGPSGLGKTTLLKLMAGLIDGAGGSITLHGKSPEEWKWPCYRSKVILVQQRPSLLNKTVRENLQRPFHYTSIKLEFSQEKVNRYFQDLQLPEKYMDKNAQLLSVGEQQRICLIRALQLDPDILLLDEPTSALDSHSTQAVEKLLIDYAEHHGIVLVSHDKEQTSRLQAKDFPLLSQKIQE